MKLSRKLKIGIVTLFALVLMGFKKDTLNAQIVCFGDSITFGALVNGHSWVSYLREEHPEIDFVNAGRSGRKTADRNELLPVLVKYPNANHYLIFLGVNDLKDGTDSMVNICVENMKWMITEIRKVNATAQITILSPSDINLKTINEINSKKKYNNNTKASLYSLRKRYKALAKQESVGFVSLLHAVNKPNYVDGLHPNLDGQKEIAACVWKGLNKLY